MIASDGTPGAEALTVLKKLATMARDRIRDALDHDTNDDLMTNLDYRHATRDFRVALATGLARGVQALMRKELPNPSSERLSRQSPENPASRGDYSASHGGDSTSPGQRATTRTSNRGRAASLPPSREQEVDQLDLR